MFLSVSVHCWSCGRKKSGTNRLLSYFVGRPLGHSITRSDVIMILILVIVELAVSAHAVIIYKLYIGSVCPF